MKITFKVYSHPTDADFALKFKIPYTPTNLKAVKRIANVRNIRIK